MAIRVLFICLPLLWLFGCSGGEPMPQASSTSAAPGEKDTEAPPGGNAAKKARRDKARTEYLVEAKAAEPGPLAFGDGEYQPLPGRAGLADMLVEQVNEDGSFVARVGRVTVLARGFDTSSAVVGQTISAPVFVDGVERRDGRSLFAVEHFPELLEPAKKIE